MSTPQQSVVADGPQTLQAAIDALTTAAQPANNIDFAELVTLAVAGAVANVGGLEFALSRRSGSWEADLVGQILQSTVGDEPEDLFAHRTVPLVIDVYPDVVLSDLDYWRLFDEAEHELQQRYEALNLPHFITRNDGSIDGDATPWTPEQEAAAEPVRDLQDQLIDLQRADIAAYGQALADAVRAAVAELFPRLPVPVEVNVHDTFPIAEAEPFEASWRVWEKAIPATPLPSSGMAPRDYPAGTSISDADRAAGRTPLARLAANANRDGEDSR